MAEWYELPISFPRDPTNGAVFMGAWSDGRPEVGYAFRHYWPDLETQRAELAELIQMVNG